MLLSFIIQEENEEPKTLEYAGKYTTKDLEKVFLELINNENDWFAFKSKPNGFVTRKKYIKTVLLREGSTV